MISGKNQVRLYIKWKECGRWHKINSQKMIDREKAFPFGPILANWKVSWFQHFNQMNLGIPGNPGRAFFITFHHWDLGFDLFRRGQVAQAVATDFQGWMHLTPLRESWKESQPCNMGSSITSRAIMLLTWSPRGSCGKWHCPGLAWAWLQEILPR